MSGTWLSSLSCMLYLAKPNVIFFKFLILKQDKTNEKKVSSLHSFHLSLAFIFFLLCNTILLSLCSWKICLPCNYFIRSTMNTNMVSAPITPLEQILAKSPISYVLLDIKGVVFNLACKHSVSPCTIAILVDKVSLFSFCENTPFPL